MDDVKEHNGNKDCSREDHTSTELNANGHTPRDYVVCDEQQTCAEISTDAKGQERCLLKQTEITDAGSVCGGQTSSVDDDGSVVSHSDSATIDSLEMDSFDWSFMSFPFRNDTNYEEDNTKQSPLCPDVPVQTDAHLKRSQTWEPFLRVGKSTMKKILTKDKDKQEAGCTTKHFFMTSQECMLVPGCRLPRETIASRLRYEKQHTAHDECPKDEYHTPTQRREQLVKDLRRQVKELAASVREKDRAIELYKEQISVETKSLVEAKDEEIHRLGQEIVTLEEKNEELQKICEESLETSAALEKKRDELRKIMMEREKQHEKFYYEMYKKGQASASFEREEELQHLANIGGCTVTISELVRKLALTEYELAKWQTIRRSESYNEAFHPETETDATLRFLRDSFFHFLTNPKDSRQHLKAVIQILNYTKTQKEKIQSSPVLESIVKCLEKLKAKAK
ncbi:hypothetical protein CHS0354_017577 [Potamilus streckersoni]|uniref:GRIP domain-containing protein n=1 Tax=Potamilus streckersoni TaxID=2493646 RepID=A0AAE0RP31_9BIVA|nr:hypothetical protein CHS0354_017577 [Potamilus streckersoni]